MFINSFHPASAAIQFSSQSANQSVPAKVLANLDIPFAVSSDARSVQVLNSKIDTDRFLAIVQQEYGRYGDFEMPDLSQVDFNTNSLIIASAIGPDSNFNLLFDNASYDTSNQALNLNLKFEEYEAIMATSPLPLSIILEVPKNFVKDNINLNILK